MKWVILVSILALLAGYIVGSIINKGRYQPIVSKCYLKDGTPMDDMVYILDTKTGQRKRDWER